jgi:hypothetical protein
MSPHVYNDYAAKTANQLVCLGCIPCDINGVAYGPTEDLSDLRTISILVQGTQPRRMIGTIDFSMGNRWTVFRYGANNLDLLNGILGQLMEWNRGTGYTVQMMSEEERQEFVRC